MKQIVFILSLAVIAVKARHHWKLSAEQQEALDSCNEKYLPNYNATQLEELKPKCKAEGMETENRDCMCYKACKHAAKNTTCSKIYDKCRNLKNADNAVYGCQQCLKTVQESTVEFCERPKAIWKCLNDTADKNEDLKEAIECIKERKSNKCNNKKKNEEVPEASPSVASA